MTSTLLRAQNTKLLSKVRRRFFQIFAAFSENPNFNFQVTDIKIYSYFWPYLKKTVRL